MDSKLSENLEALESQPGMAFAITEHEIERIGLGPFRIIEDIVGAAKFPCRVAIDFTGNILVLHVNLDTLSEGALQL